MDSRKLDQLFRETLAHHEVEPSSESWKLVSEQIQSKARPVVWMRVAAAVALVAVSAFILWNQRSIGTPDGHLASAPELQETDAIVWPEVTLKAEKLEQVVFQRQVRAFDRPEKTPEVQIALEDNSLAMPGAVVSIKPSLVEPGYVSIHLLPNKVILGPEVQMTYLAGTNPPEDSRSGIEKLWAKAKEMSPGEMWGSIRDTKNELLSFNRN